MKGIILVVALFIIPVLFSRAGSVQIVQDSISGWVVDSVGAGISDILVEEILDGRVVGAVVTDASGWFKIHVKGSLRFVIFQFSAPAYNEYETRRITFDLLQNCQKLTIHMKMDTREREENNF